MTFHINTSSLCEGRSLWVRTEEKSASQQFCSCDSASPEGNEHPPNLDYIIYVWLSDYTWTLIPLSKFCPYRYFFKKCNIIRGLKCRSILFRDLELSSPRAESARAVTGRRNSHRWERGRLFEPSAGFFYGNSCNFGTKSRKIVSKVGN